MHITWTLTQQPKNHLAYELVLLVVVLVLVVVVLDWSIDFFFGELFFSLPWYDQ